MSELPGVRLAEYRTEKVHVGVFSTLRAGKNTYSVPSRLIGEEVEARLYPDSVEVIYAGETVCRMDRLRGTGNAWIDYRHVIFSLVRKPGAFARYRYREALFPSAVFRLAYDTLQKALGEKADAEYVRILHLAATTSESDVEEALSSLMARGELKACGVVRDAVRQEAPAVPICQIAEVDLTIYDQCLTGKAA